MFKKFKSDESEKDIIVSCASNIINTGILLNDHSSARSMPNVEFKDNKGNTLYLCWYSSSLEARDVAINGLPVPREYDQIIFKMAQERIEVLKKEHIENMIRNIK